MGVALVLAQIAALDGAATVLVGGDVVPHPDVIRSVASHGAASLLGPVAGVLSRAEVTVLNFESPAMEGRGESVDGSLRFNASRRVVLGVAGAGVDVVTLANNHGYDQGPEGIAATIEALRAVRVETVGASTGADDPLAPREVLVRGRTLCLFAATRILNFPVPAPRAGRPRLAMVLPSAPDEERAFFARVRAASSRCGATVVMLHTGTEYGDAPEARDRVLFRALAEAGASAVIGHHSHTPHPVEVVRVRGRDVPLFYSLGNVVSGQGSVAERAPLTAGEAFQVERDPRTREGLLAVLQFVPEGATGLRVARAGWVPLWTASDLDAVRGTAVVPTISATMMPWEGGGSRFLQRRWRALVGRVGAATLFDGRTLQGAAY